MHLLRSIQPGSWNEWHDQNLESVEGDRYQEAKSSQPSVVTIGEQPGSKRCHERKRSLLAKNSQIILLFVAEQNFDGELFATTLGGHMDHLSRLQRR